MGGAFFLDVLNLGLQGRDVQKNMKLVSTFALTVELPLLVCGGACQNTFPFPYNFFFGEIARVLTGNRTACVIGGTRIFRLLILGLYGRGVERK